jgi:membrane-associated phospholipid phosphatase
MAEILRRLWPVERLWRVDLWPVDKIILVYFVFICAIELIWFEQIPGAAALLALHAAGVTLILLAAHRLSRKWVTWTFRHWYPLLFVASCYREMAILIPVIRRVRADQFLADLDFALWHTNPTVWLERMYSPLFTESLQIIYTLFVPIVLLVPWLIWHKKHYTDFRYMAFLLSLGFLISYLGYLLLPARGPRFLLQQLQHVPLRGLWLFDSMRATLDRLERAHYDCFPSGHVELTVLACWLSRLISRRLFLTYIVYTLCVVFATVYLRYHYTVDVVAGILVALVLILATPAIYRGLSVEGDSIGD